jgi:hypothetical protein
MGAEDFSEFGKRYEDSIKNGTPLPSLHSSEFAPSPRPTIRTGVAPLTVAEVWSPRSRVQAPSHWTPDLISPASFLHQPRWCITFWTINCFG